MTTRQPKRIALFLSFSGQGGVEHMMLRLAGGLIDAGYGVDLVVARASGLELHTIPDGVRVVRLGTRHSFTALPALARYLRRERPDALLAAKDRAIRTAVLARALARVRVPLAGRLGTTVSAALEGRSALKRAVWYAGMRRFYKHVDRIVAVSQGVADDVRRITGLPGDRLVVVRNPVWTPTLEARAREPVDHPWLTARQAPVLVGAGRLTRQKDFPTLLRAFARLRAERSARLVILGEGDDRADLEALARELGIEHDVAMPGFVTNPHAWIGRADLFALSSLWEGSPNALTEALALGVPVVSTDCPSGPREILADGRYGPLVPMGDADALAQAIRRTLDDPLPPETLKEAAEPYNVERSVEGYLNALGLGSGS